MSVDKRLRTVKKAAQEIGSSPSFFRQLMYEGKLTPYKINRAVFVSLTEFEEIALPIKKAQIDITADVKHIH